VLTVSHPRADLRRLLRRLAHLAGVHKRFKTLGAHKTPPAHRLPAFTSMLLYSAHCEPRARAQT